MKLAHPQQSLGDLQFSHPLPKVSVLIRATGRASLAAAVKSVQRQRFKNWELLVVNAGGKPLAPLATEEAKAITQLIEPGVPLDRSSAANTLLDSAKGQYAVFLDDDDWFLDDHLEKLVSVLEADSSLIAAYGDVECISGAGTANQKTAHLFARDFDPAALQLQNYLPIHSVMFRLDRVRMTPASQFERELQLFEDWDFWLQLAAKGRFQRVPGISAIYALSPESGSGHAEDANAQRLAMLASLGARQLHRWHASDVAALILNEASRTNEFNHEKQSADLARQQVVRLEQHATQLEQSADLARQQVVRLEQYATQLEQSADLARQQVVRLEQYATQLEQQAMQLEGHAAELALQLADIKRSLNELQAYSRLQQTEIDTLSHIRIEHLKQLDNLYQSHSWRITQPLRLASRCLIWLKSPSPLRLARNLSRAVLGEVRRNGVLGTARRLPYYLKHHRTYLGLLHSRPPAADGNSFEVSPFTLRDIRLHPDLTGGGATIDAKVSVVIPTLNAGPEFVWMLRKLRAQLAVREVEIVIVDSGSRDATVQVSRDAGAKVIEIQPEEFSHSYARNLGADNATGDYVLFMVQDAYPIGNHWMYGMLRYLLDHADQGLVAASCAEYSRGDSDMMYDSMINTHYRFLGCLDHDRIGEYCGDDHMSLRSRGQLSDVSCLISRDCFQQFRYRGNYAEDLDLGIRLIKSGKRVAMMASVKVIHSHNRPAYYYLKRSFVDVVFLVGLFDDFSYPHCESLQGLLAGIESTAATISEWLVELETDAPQCTLSAQLDTWIRQSRRVASPVRPGGSLLLGDDRLDTFILNMTPRYIGSATGTLGTLAQNEARHFSDTFLARLEHFNNFAAEVYGQQDSVLRRELGDVVRKTFASAVGSALAFYCLDHKRPDDAAYDTAQLIHNELAAGV
ncbi:MAG: glycosyltransferase [Comamonadaceae bacterium]|nr:glycosyltransferase [Comamonadaceae bacterium]